MSLRNGNLLKQTDLTARHADVRATVLASYGALGGEVEELLHYNCNCFDLAQGIEIRFPLADEACVQEWAAYASEVTKANSLTAVYQWLPQLQFPIQRGLSQLPEYQAAVRRGQFIYPEGIATGLDLEAPNLCRVILQPTGAGRIPVIIAGSRSDFVALIRAFTKKGEPEPVPDSMGAVILGGVNNLHRINALRAAHLASGNPEWTWTEKFQEIKQQKQLYQDRFVILSPGPYSDVPAAALQLDEPLWETISLAIRLEHECTHYFTRRVFGSMRNNLLDELIADYCGLVKATGTYEATWALRFLGIEEEGEYRAGGRLENYQGDPPLSPGAFRVLVRLARGAVANLRRLNTATAAWRCTDAYRVASVLAIANFTLEELAAPGGERDMLECFQASIESLLQAEGTA